MLEDIIKDYLKSINEATQKALDVALDASICSEDEVAILKIHAKIMNNINSAYFSK